MSTIELVIEELSQFSQSIEIFRDYINTQKLHYDHCKDKKSFNFLCSAIDMILDTMLALQAYLENHHQNQSLLYLEIFGVLESLYIQQEAIREIDKIIKKLKKKTLDLKNFPKIDNVRDIRNKIIHHTGSANFSSFIIRHFISKWSFQLVGYHSQNGERSSKTVYILNLIYDNAQGLNLILSELIKKIEYEYEYDMKVFSQNFKILSNCRYYVITLHEERPNHLKITNLDYLEQNILTFCDKLKENQPHFSSLDLIKNKVPQLLHSINKLRQFLKSEEKFNKHDF